MKGWLLIESLLVLLLPNAIVWFAIAQGWPQLLPLPIFPPASRMGLP